jgi:multidrug efflux pump
MSLSAPFIARPTGTTLLVIAVALAGTVAYQFLPTSPIPQVEFPTIGVNAALPGASPETMASAVATPLERQFGRIAGITEMTSTSFLGFTSITLQFDLGRNIDAAARDVQSAINAARGQLPANLPSNPSYRKVNPADSPILILAMTSDIHDTARLYDIAATIVQQKLAQIQGVGQVFVGGGSLPAVRVDVNPTQLNNYGLGLEDIRSVLAAANANRPKGELADARQTQAITTTDQLLTAEEYRPLVVTYRRSGAVLLRDVATVTDSVEDLRTFGMFNGKTGVQLVVFRQPGANMIETVDRVLSILPTIQAEIPPAMKISVGLDRTTTIRASIHDIQFTMAISIALVILVVFVFLRSVRTTIIPSIAVPVTLIGTCGVMYLLGYSIDNLSLMALTVATGFVVDDAIVVIENITRHLEAGMSPMQATVLGAREIGSTVLTMSTSLTAVFIPILLMGGIVGRLFREFAVTLTVAILVSMLISLTVTPMLCSRLLRHHTGARHGLAYRFSEWCFNVILRAYDRSLSFVLRHQPITLIVTLATIGLTVHLYMIVPKGFFPQQDTGRMSGQIQGDQQTSFQAMQERLGQFVEAVREDPDVERVLASMGGGGMGGGGTQNIARMFVSLRGEGRTATVDEVIARIRRGKASRIPGATLFLQSTQDLRIGGRGSSAQYQYTLQGDTLAELAEWAPRMIRAMRDVPGVVDLNSDMQNKGLQASLAIDRTTASRLGISPKVIDDTLYDAFGQRQVSTMYTQLNQYHVVMGVEPAFLQNPDGLKYLYVRGSKGQVPLSAFTSYVPRTSPLAVNQSGQFPSVTISFNLSPGTPLGDAVEQILDIQRNLAMPASIHGSFSGTAQAFQESLNNQPVLIAAALIAVYIVLGMLYESMIHPITILSTLPSAGVGALLALILCRNELSVIALIGIILLIGIVKKNAIMMIDFAVEAERQDKTSEQAIYEACMLRFRPIIMTTMAALLGGLPLALGTGVGSELRRPLGIAIVGGLALSQVLTLYTTPVVYLYLDRFRLRLAALRRRAPAEVYGD